MGAHYSNLTRLMRRPMATEHGQGVCLDTGIFLEGPFRGDNEALTNSWRLVIDVVRA